MILRWLRYQLQKPLYTKEAKLFSLYKTSILIFNSTYSRLAVQILLSHPWKKWVYSYDHTQLQVWDQSLPIHTRIKVCMGHWNIFHKISNGLGQPTWVSISWLSVSNLLIASISFNIQQRRLRLHSIIYSHTLKQKQTIVILMLFNKPSQILWAHVATTTVTIVWDSLSQQWMAVTLTLDSMTTLDVTWQNYCKEETLLSNTSEDKEILL